MTDLATAQGWLKIHQGFTLNALSIELPEQALDECMSRLIQAGELSLHC